jgi:hypothetical protein
LLFILLLLTVLLFILVEILGGGGNSEEFDVGALGVDGTFGGATGKLLGVAVFIGGVDT